MKRTQDIEIDDYAYELPDERIAKFPVTPRDSSRLLVYDNGVQGSYRFADLPGLLPDDVMLVFNNTRVIQARLRFRKETGALIEVFCLEPLLPADYALSLQSTATCRWLCLIGNARKWKSGELALTFEHEHRPLTLRARKGQAHGDGYEIEFAWDDASVTFGELLDTLGELPIPPYLNRKTEESDKTTYQTVYSKVEGSVAAPTAGLHFTPAVLAALQARAIPCEELTLHVGAGTFKPVKSEEIGDHTMHSEWIAVRRESIERLMAHGGHCTAVGTTSVRTLESLYYIGVLLHANPEAQQDDLHVPQWLPYEYAEAGGPRLTTMEALQCILDYLDRRSLPVLHTATQIIIAPGYEFHVVHRIITNFHQPQSTLLLLVSAFVYGRWREIYDFALANGFRFLSYGDSSLLEIPPHDRGSERLPVVNAEGQVVGSATRAECHSGSKLLHPVVHLHVYNLQGELFLQKRPMWKDIQPGRWDTAVGGHVDWGEEVHDALVREVREEIGLTDVEPEFVARYVYESRCEKELVHVFRVKTDRMPVPSEELDGGRFFSHEEIMALKPTECFTPNFISEYERFLAPSSAMTDAVAADEK